MPSSGKKFVLGNGVYFCRPQATSYLLRSELLKLEALRPETVYSADCVDPFSLLFSSGYKYNQEDKNPWQPPNKQNCDGINLIFKDFHKAGYTTLYNEDFVSGSTFHYKMNGFDKPPTDWYPRSYWIAAHERVEGCGRPPCICEDEEMIRFLKTFTTFCEDEAKFSIQVTANAHDDMNLLFMLEDQLIGKGNILHSPISFHSSHFLEIHPLGRFWGGVLKFGLNIM